VREPVLSDPPETEAFLRLRLGLEEYEVFGLLHLNTAHRLIAVQDLFRGTLTRCSVYAREVVRSVLHHNSACAALYPTALLAYPIGCNLRALFAGGGREVGPSSPLNRDRREEG
jgi:hypothetical protein